MTKLTYRGQQYTCNTEVQAPADVVCTYRGVDYNPAKQEQVELTPVTLTYRGAEYQAQGFNALARIQARQQRQARRAGAQKMQRNAAAIF